MSAKHDEAPSRGQRSNTTVSPTRIGPWPISCPMRPAARGDDELVGGAAVRGEGLRDRRLHTLDRQWLALEPEHPVAVLRGAQQRDTRRHPRFGGALRAANPFQLERGLRTPAGVEQALVDGELHAGSARAARSGRRGRSAAPTHARARHPRRLAPPIRGGSSSQPRPCALSSSIPISSSGCTVIPRPSPRMRSTSIEPM